MTARHVLTRLFVTVAAASLPFAGAAASPSPLADADAAPPPLRSAAAAGYLSIEAVPVETTPVEVVDTAFRNPGWVIYLDGQIETGADARLAQLLAGQGISAAVVYFNSPGGSLLAAMAIGRLLRARGFTTSVGRRTVDARRPAAGVCYSACPFAYAGGTERTLEAGSIFGVHRAENRGPVPDGAAFERRVRDDTTQYLAEMGVNADLVALMTAVPHQVLRLITHDEAERLQLLTEQVVAQR
jgi:hypothetical protein